MTANEKELIKKFISGKIGKDEFLRSYPIDLVSDPNYIILNLENAYTSENTEDVDLGLSLLYFDKDFKNSGKYVPILCQLLQVSWHHRHEDIVTLLQGLRDPDSVDALYMAAISKHSYLDYDDTYALARKCIHALGDINTQHAKEKLLLLAKSSVSIIREKAEKQLYYYKR